jgi:BirA family transcriptional regulator, biotin operon repressor / biotin---[acetyl-CoA-carboxylase] ligase
MSHLLSGSRRTRLPEKYGGSYQPASSVRSRMTEDIDTAILTLLSSSPGYLSGEKIACELNLTRAAIWKRIKGLRQTGCAISSSPRLGYRLLSLPDLLLPSFVRIGLKTSLIGQQILYYPEVDSTNLQAKTLAVKGVANGTLVVTEFQTQGQGRLKRKWVSPSGENLLFSIVFYPSLRPPQIFQLTLLSSLAVCKSLIAIANVSAGIKWPNDVFVNNRKVSGILTEFSANPDQVHWAVVGIGVNVNFDPSVDPEISDIATSLRRETGQRHSRILLLRSIVEHLDRLYRQFLSGELSKIREEWLSHSIVLGKPVTIISDTIREEGVAESIEEDGALVLRTPAGGRKRVIYGDLSLRFQETGDRIQKSE